MDREEGDEVTDLSMVDCVDDRTKSIEGFSVTRRDAVASIR
jgi:hypothetical protein